MMEYQIPSQILHYFGSECLRNLGTDGQHVETLAVALGHKKDNQILIEELIFPKQSGSSFNVEDLGKLCFNFNSILICNVLTAFYVILRY